ncbi:MAG: cysteine hydrolase [Gammaproteobacteria bacterium]
MKRELHVLVIDPQNDFCDLPESYLPIDGDSALSPALPVPGAHADMLRVARLIREAGAGLTAVTVTLDTHYRLDIAHPTFWTDGQGGEVAPFTEITAAQVRAGQYLPREREHTGRTLAYLDELESAGRYRLMVWPVHCEIGSWGQQVHADVQAALEAWEHATDRRVERVTKGANPWTEHYSAIQAEVPLHEDAATQLNRTLIAALAASDEVFIVGEAGSHCVRATTEHLAEHFPQDQLSKLVLLTDCMSPVSGFEAQQQAFLDAMRAKGLRTARAADVLPQLVANAA